MSFLACCPYSAPMLLTQSKNRGLHSWWWFGRIWQHNNHKNSLLILEQKFDQCLSLFFQYNMHVWNKHFLPSNSTNAAWKEPNTKCRIWPWNNMHIYYIGCTLNEWKNHCPPKKAFLYHLLQRPYHCWFPTATPCHTFMSFSPQTWFVCHVIPFYLFAASFPMYILHRWAYFAISFCFTLM